MFSNNKYHQWLLKLAILMIFSIILSLVVGKLLMLEEFRPLVVFYMISIAFFSAFIVWIPFKRGLINIGLEIMLLVAIYILSTLGSPDGDPDAAAFYFLGAMVGIIWSLLCFGFASIGLFLFKFVRQEKQDS